MPRYIDAEKMQSLLEEEIEGCGYPISDNKPIAYGVTLGLKMALSYTKTLTTADVAPVVHGHWKRLWTYMFECSRCKRAECLEGFRGLTIDEEKSIILELYPYCHCGAKMDEEDCN